MHLTLTQGVESAIPISIQAFSGEDSNHAVSAIIRADLQNSGRFSNSAVTPPDTTSFDESFWRKQKVNYVVMGTEQVTPNQQLQIHVALYDVYHSAQQLAPIYQATYQIESNQLRALAHAISDSIYQNILGVPGAFSTKLAYVSVQHEVGSVTKYRLMIADYDGENASPLLVSNSPIMSPAWSPDGQKIAYVSFESGLPAIYISTIASGHRQLITNFPGLNSAPRFSPDGKRLAVVLSRRGTPDIYVVNLSSGQLQRISQVSAINTAPSWSVAGQHLLFTSNRGGTPQIYQIAMANKRVKRLSFNGSYNTDAQYLNPNKIVLLHRGNDSGQAFSIAIQDLKSGEVSPLILGNVQSPSPAPNGGLIAYIKTLAPGDTELAMISSNGSAKLSLPNNGSVIQSPAWSPYLAKGPFKRVD